MSLAAIFAVIAAPFIGSFLAVLAVRLPLQEDPIAQRSHCRGCAKRLSPLELVPIISWFALGGKCKSCGSSIDLTYLIAEIGALILAVWTVSTIDGWVVWPTLLLGWALWALSLMDWRSLFLSDFLTLPLVALGLLTVAGIEPTEIVGHVSAVALGFGLIRLTSQAYRWVRGRDGLGLGDAKLLAASGAWTGIAGLGSTLLYAVAFSLLLALAMKSQGKVLDGATQIPFGIGIAAGTWLTWLYGPISLVT